jgi:fructose-specific phosphotransferase system IIC component
MLRFITHNLTGINGVSIYPIISLLIFVIFFAIVLTRVINMSKSEITELGEIPFDEHEKTEQIG